MNEATYVYIVHSDINENNIYAEFATEEEAIEYARRNKDELTYVDKVEAALDEDGEIIEIFDGQTIWVYDDEFDGYADDMEENVFDTDFDGGYPLDEGINLKNDAERKEFFQLCDEIGIITTKDIINFKKEVGCTDDNLLQALRDYRAELGPDFKIANPELERELAMKYEGIDFDKLVEELEEFEDEVECRECYGLFPKESCIKGEHGYVCEKCSKTLTESISELTPEQLAEMDAYLRSGKDLSLDDFEEEHDFGIDLVGGELTYNSKTNDFTFYLSIYHASEDNNAEYPEYHTDEEEISFDTIEDIYAEYPQYLEDMYKWHAGKFSKLEESKCSDCGGELKDNKCTSCNRDFNLAKCKYCGGEVKDGKCTHCDTKVDMVKCQYCGGEVIDNKCTSCNELVESSSSSSAVNMLEIIKETVDKNGHDYWVYGGSGYVANCIEIVKEGDNYVANEYVSTESGRGDTDPEYITDNTDFKEVIKVLLDEKFFDVEDRTYQEVTKEEAEEYLFEAIKMTRDELMDKEGTDDVELINAGRPEEERVELVEEDADRKPFYHSGEAIDYTTRDGIRRLDVLVSKARKHGPLTIDSVRKVGGVRNLVKNLNCKSLEEVENLLDTYFNYLPDSIYNRGIEAYDEIVSELPEILWELKNNK